MKKTSITRMWDFFLLKIEERNVEFFLLQIEERETLKKEEDKI